MISSLVNLLSLLPVFLLSVYFFRYLVRLSICRGDAESPPLPPGPCPLPLVGNLPFLKPELHSYFSALSAVHGPIFKLYFGSKLCIVVSSPSGLRAILRDNDIVFANRDVPASVTYSAYGGRDIIWSPYGPQWRMLRKVCVAKMLSNKMLDSVYHLRRNEVSKTVRYFYEKAGLEVNVRDRIFITVMNVMTSMLWGDTVEEEERERVGSEFVTVVKDMTRLLGLPNISDFFPWLRRFDIQGMEKKIRGLMERFDVVFERIIAARLEQEKEGEHGHGEVKDFLQYLMKVKGEEDAKTPLTMIEVKSLLLDMVVGGTDTSASTIEFAMAEILNEPSVLANIHDELDKIVGKDNILEESHIRSLPYLQAVMKETLRLHPALPLLIPHCPSETCTVEGYTFPKDSQVMINVWAIHRDPKVWENPLQFDPSRFLEACKGDFASSDLRYSPFGAGRRMCAGLAMGERMVLYALGRLLHSFDWRAAGDGKVDITEQFGIVLTKKRPLIAVPSPRLSNPQLYA
ncbi:hypothetical protein MLD38_010926 [Melastoma candidum]|uniref:Uncharacterized protein n=1 Tax=Melastoma candidum TaxID=119954 RepID=A0ACB9R9R0_9MYRT|nr:hypothetical protein MLD38_010926 [Melastoma candidum]